MKQYQTAGLTNIFDISGGDMANDAVDYLDYDQIAKSDAVFWGYSDLTSVINAIYQKTGRISHLFQIRNLVRDSTGHGTGMVMIDYSILIINFCGAIRSRASWWVVISAVC